jgi:hypothetical protein
VHSYLTEGAQHEAVSKLEELIEVVVTRESRGIDPALHCAKLFMRICGRQARTLTLCARLIERTLKNQPNQSNNNNSNRDRDRSGNNPGLKAEVEASALALLGEIYLWQATSTTTSNTTSATTSTATTNNQRNQQSSNNSNHNAGPGENPMLSRAISVLKDAAKRDPSNVYVLLLLIQAHLLDTSSGVLQAVEDAEAQMELLLLMHNVEELGYLALFTQYQIDLLKLSSHSNNNNNNHNSHYNNNNHQALTLTAKNLNSIQQGPRKMPSIPKLPL